MEDNKQGMYILAIVAIIAIVGLVVMIGSAGRAKVNTATLSGDTAGQASKVMRGELLAQEAEAEIGKITLEPLCGNNFREDPEQCDGNDLGFKKTQMISLLLNRSQTLNFTGNIYKITLLGLNQQNQDIIIRVNGETKTIEKYQNRKVGGLTLSLERVYEDSAKITLKANPYNCNDLGFAGGNLMCYDGCQYNTSQCIQASVCGNGIIEQGEQCDGNNLGGLRCTDLGFIGGNLRCTNDCVFDTSGCTNSNASILAHYIEAYGNKDYNLNEIWRYTYNFGAYAFMTTNQEAEAYLSAQCSNSQWDWKTLYAQASGKTSLPYWGGSIPEMSVNAFTANGVNFESLTANCYSWGHIKETQENSNKWLDFNTEAKSYPSILSAGMSKNAITGKYMVYFNATNYNGGICRVYYSIYNPDAHNSIYWETDLPDCPYNVDFWDIVPVNSTIGNMTRLWLSLSLRPSLQSNSVYTSGSGLYVFDAQAKPLKIGGEMLIPLESVTPDEREQAQLTQKSNEFFLEVVKANARK